MRAACSTASRPDWVPSDRLSCINTDRSFRREDEDVDTFEAVRAASFDMLFCLLCF